MGTAVTGVVIALTSTLVARRWRPRYAGGGGDERARGSVAAALAAKGASTDAIIVNVLVALSVSTFLTGVLLFGSARSSSANGCASCPIP